MSEAAAAPGSGAGPGGGSDRDTTSDGAVDRVDYDPHYDPGSPVHCEVCEEVMYYTAACKLKCPRCGYTRDCSDP